MDYNLLRRKDSYIKVYKAIKKFSGMSCRDYREISRRKISLLEFITGENGNRGPKSLFNKIMNDKLHKNRYPIYEVLIAGVMKREYLDRFNYKIKNIDDRTLKRGAMLSYPRIVCAPWARSAISRASVPS